MFHLLPKPVQNIFLSRQHLVNFVRAACKKARSGPPTPELPSWQVLE